MRKVFLILCLSVILPVVRASAGEVKLTTYYPSPYGEYTRMATKTLGVGDTNHDGKVSMTDAPDPATNPGDAIIAGNIYMQKGIYYGGGTCNGNGDVDGNGQITPLDVLCIINWINNGTASGMTPAEFARADIGGDGSVNAVDCYALIQWINSGHSEVMPTSTNPPKSLLPRIWPSALGTTWTGTLTAGTPWVVTYTGFQIGATCSDWFTLRQQPGLNVFGATNFYNSVIMNRYANLKYIGGTGDVDGNGLIQALDVDYIASYLTGSSLTPLQYARADVNHDGIVDQADADMIIAAINAGGAPEAVNTEVPVNVPNRIYYRPISAGYDGSVSLPGDFAVRSGKVGIGTTVDATAVLNVKGRIKSTMARATISANTDWSTTSTSWVDTDLVLTITSTGGNLLCMFNSQACVSGGASLMGFRFVVDGTAVTTAPLGNATIQENDQTRQQSVAMNWLTPALDAGSHTIKVQVKVTGNRGYLNEAIATEGTERTLIVTEM